MSKQKKLSIIVPAFNEVEVIDTFYARVKRVVETLDSLSYEIIFVDGGSKDGLYQKL